MRTINASDFKARCLAILDRERATGERAEVLTRGQSVAELWPVGSLAEYPSRIEGYGHRGRFYRSGRHRRRAIGRAMLGDGLARHSHSHLVAEPKLSTVVAQKEVLAAADADSPLLVSDISLWEAATLYTLGRIQITLPLRVWPDKAVAPPLTATADRASPFGRGARAGARPDSFHRDPADRVLVAAPAPGATLLTQTPLVDAGVATLN